MGRHALDRPLIGHCSAAAMKASCKASSAASKLPSSRISVGKTRRLSWRYMRATVSSSMAPD